MNVAGKYDVVNGGALRIIAACKGFVLEAMI